ncbi:hypothetical protein LPJ66_005746 [Kickxella alabastrina]|uniref:Uncharacterized protein n=1 Tax=Kickxella alabastrina TaxID=61397 RepID=A0ACC1IDP0_9FUNG|nr:hypothetical protein LPJ66_005746 [Kickxella alabastrina]
MSARVPTAFRPLETNKSFGVFEAPVPRRTATAAPSSIYYGTGSSIDTDSYAQERMQLLSRLEQRWYPVRPSTCNPCSSSDCAQPIPRRSYPSSFSGMNSAGTSRPSSSSSQVDLFAAEDAACMELRGIFGNSEFTGSASRSSSANSSIMDVSSRSFDSDMGLFPLEEIIVCPQTPPMRSHNPVPLNTGFGRGY